MSAGQMVLGRTDVDGSSLYYSRTSDIVDDRVDAAAGERLTLTYLSQDASYALVIEGHFTGLTRPSRQPNQSAGYDG